jgi:hypothetical protein
MMNEEIVAKLNALGWRIISENDSAVPFGGVIWYSLEDETGKRMTRNLFEILRIIESK